MRDDSLPDADRTLEAPDATYDERDLAGEIHLLDHEPDANLLSTAGAARDALYGLARAASRAASSSSSCMRRNWFSPTS